MRKFFVLLLAVAAILAVFPFSALGSAAEFSDVVFEDAVRVHKSGTYPRMTSLKNGALEYYYQDGYKYSLDSGATFNANDETAGISVKTNAATTCERDGVVHSLKRENHHALELSDGTVMVAYRSLTNGAEVGDPFYSSIRVMTKTNYTGVYDNEQIVVEATSTVVTRGRGFWEPFLIQLDEDTVAMYYADDLTPGDDGANQYIMVVLYDMRTGTWGEPMIALNEAKDMGREGMPMVARLVDGSYVMACESHCMWNSGKYIFVVRLWFSEDGINWDKGVVVATPNIKHNFWDSGLLYNSAAPCVTVLPDGRIAVSYQDNYAGLNERQYKNADYNEDSTPCIILSKDKVTYDNCTNIVASTKGVSSSFEELTPTFKNHSLVPAESRSEVYGVWNSTFYANGYLYFCAAIGYNTSDTSRQGLGTFLCRALVDESEVPDSEKVAEDYGTLHVSNPEQLLQIMNDSTMWTKSIVLDNDIDLSKAIYDKSRGLGQTSIGYLNGASFKGKFDGRGYTIRGIDISNSVSDNKTGLFGYCDGATLKNCTIYGSVTSTSAYTGGFAGYSQNSVFENLISYVTVSGTSNVGGIAGRLHGATSGGLFVDCVNYGKVTGTGSAVGGIVGLLDVKSGSTKETKTLDCVNYGEISAKNFAGGIIGRINQFNQKANVITVSGHVNYGKVSASATDSYVGGIFGHAGINTDTDVKNTNNGVLNVSDCDNYGAITGNRYVAGVAGNVNFLDNGTTGKFTITRCRNFGDIGGTSSAARIGGVVGRILGNTTNKAQMSECYNEGSVTAGASGTDIGGIIAVIQCTDVSNCESRGDITVTNTTLSNIGGIVGKTASSTSVKNCYFNGKTAMNAISGSTSGCTFENNYYYLVSGKDDAKGTAVAEENSKTSYAGLSFYDVWYDTVHGPRLVYDKQLVAGDANDDGSIDLLDVAVMERYIAKWNGYDETIHYFACDINRDGSIDLADVAYLARHIAGWRDYLQLPEN